MAMERWVPRADACTVASRFLRGRFGGVLVPHGRDTTAFDPARFDRDVLRERWGITTEPVILFLGTPRPWKGLDDLIAAARQVQHPALKVMLVGVSPDSAYGRSLAVHLPPEHLVLVPGCSFSEVPRFLAMADLVVVPQRRSLASKGQVPAKVFDAMAMARPIVATDVSDLPEILEGCGIIVPAGDVDRIAEAVVWILEHPAEAAEMGRRARQKCVEHYSLDVMERLLREVFFPLGGRGK
jgi:glycosyltransferase involved in cell wall biosynthesis